MEFIDVSAKTIEEATLKGQEQLSQEGRQFVNSEVIAQPSNGFLGIGRKPAVVRLYFKTAEVKPQVNAENSVEKTENTTHADMTPVVEEIQEKPVLSKEVQATIGEKGKQFLQDMFNQMGLSVMIEKMTSEDRITYQIHGQDLGILIGKHGQTLDAIQYLTNLVANKETPGHCHIIVDVENYRSRREETLTQLAHRLAHKVRRTGQKVSLEPMNAYERKLIHTALQGEKNIVTDSEGEEPYRHVVIALKQ